ncbi:MAG: STAS domain-containing protein [Chitinophagaceae bacterium]
MIDFKIDTKEKFSVLTPTTATIYDNMTENLSATCYAFLEKEQKNVILNLSEVAAIDASVADAIASIQQKFYEQNASFVICCVQPTVDAVFEELEIADILNQTPTESEAWDIIQMEEIERELLDTDDIEFESNE